jgi:isopenicillin N synthase-like dioxygenase
VQSLPIIDLSARGRAGTAAALAQNCEEVGFFMLTGHGVPASLLQAMRDTCYRFFDLSAAGKQAVVVLPNSNRGYRGVRAGSLALSAGEEAPPDLRETFLMGPPDCPPGVAPEDCFEPNLWAASLPEMEKVFTAYYRAMAALAARVLDLAGDALRLPDGYFRPFIDRCISQLSIAHYPAQLVAPLPEQLRASAHTDFGTLTLLLAEDKPGGLQIQGPDGAWQDVTPPGPDCYVVNLGDLMARWTNDRWRSTLHRVVNPPLEAGAAARRLSIVFFHHPNEDAVIKCLPGCASPERPPLYPPTTPGQHMKAKVAAIFSKSAPQRVAGA